MRTSPATERSGERPTLSRGVAATASTQSARRSVAAALSLAAPGVGHLFAGLPKRAAGAWVMTRVVGLLAAAAVVVAPGRIGLVAYGVVWLAVLIAVAVDVVRVMRRPTAGRDLGRRWYQRTAVLVVACGVVWVASLAWSMVVADAIVEQVRIRTAAMAPTILRGERLWVAPRRGGQVHRGDLVAYRLWDTPFVKRVVGVPGDTLAMNAGTLSVDGRPAVESYAQHAGEGEIRDRRFDWQRAFVLAPDRATYAPTLATWGPLVVPSANYFLLGDNRGETTDSRYNGFVADSSIFGRPLTVYFSRDPVAGWIRWSRIGIPIKETRLAAHPSE